MEVAVVISELLFSFSFLILIPVDEALKQVQAILGTTKNPRFAADEDHTYEDKYALAEFVTNSSIAAILHILDRLGLDAVKLQTVLKWVVEDKKTVTLSFRAEDRCAYHKETEVEHIVSPDVNIETTETTTQDDSSPSQTTTRTAARVVKIIKQHHWNININYAIAVYPGQEETALIELQARNTTATIVTSGGSFGQTQYQPKPPIAEYTIHKPIETDITWLLTALNREAGICQFSIDRSKDTCKTPRRNEPIEAALKFQHDLHSWCHSVQYGFFQTRVEKQILDQSNQNQVAEAKEIKLSQGITDGKEVYRPVIPVLENGTVLDGEETASILNAHSNSIDQARANVVQMFPSTKKAKLATESEATIVLLCNHAKQLTHQYQVTIDYIEGMLTKQMVSAIGKHVTHHDFERFMRFHNRRLFGEEYRPKPFNYAIRRPDHYPDGVLSIEGATSDNQETESIETFVRKSSDETSIFMPLNAATSVELKGQAYLHGWLRHQFEQSRSTSDCKIVARARQFSGFALVIGSMAGKDQFSPKHALILQNKDEVMIPLLSDILPSAKEFKDSIASLSPEQQAFAKAYRNMQLESSVIGLCVIQLKPQLEKLLKLPDGSLTKEIQLTQDLLSCFVEYQIPSDLMSFDGLPSLSQSEKLEAVKGHVKAVLDVVNGEKERQLVEEERKEEMRLAQERQTMNQKSFGQQRSTGFGSAPFGSPAPAGGFFGAQASPQVGAYAVGGIDAPPPQAVRQMQMAAPPGGMPERGVVFSPAQDTASLNENPTSPEAQIPGSEMALDLEDGDDFTLIPKVLDGKVEKLDSDNALKSTILKTGPTWSRYRQENLLTKGKTSSLASKTIEQETKKAFDLLDALSRSGTLSIECAELHVVVALSHCFTNDVMGTIIQNNENPIEKSERSSLIVASVIHDEPSPILLRNQADIGRLGAKFPSLFLDEE